MTAWRKELEIAMEGVDPGPVIAYAPDEAAFDVELDDDYGAGLRRTTGTTLSAKAYLSDGLRLIRS